MYARVDTGCWQAGAGGSVAAHELMHNLGGIQGSAGHSTPYGHCDDDNDLMCYADGPGVTMNQVCPAADEPLFDCKQRRLLRHQPRPGSYLATKLEHRQVLVPRRRGTRRRRSTPWTRRPALTVAVAGPATVRPGLPASLAAAGSATGTFAWTLDKARCVDGEHHERHPHGAVPVVRVRPRPRDGDAHRGGRTHRQRGARAGPDRYDGAAHPDAGAVEGRPATSGNESSSRRTCSPAPRPFAAGSRSGRAPTRSPGAARRSGGHRRRRRARQGRSGRDARPSTGPLSRRRPAAGGCSRPTSPSRCA